MSPENSKCSYVVHSGLGVSVGASFPVWVNPDVVRCRPFGAGVRYIICGDSQISAEHSALVKLSACKVTTFFLNMQILLGQIAFFCRILVVLWEVACGWWLFMPIFDGE